MEDCGESNAECCVLLVGVDRVMYIFRGFCGVCSWQNGTRCRDGGKYCVVQLQIQMLPCGKYRSKHQNSLCMGLETKAKPYKTQVQSARFL